MQLIHRGTTRKQTRNHRYDDNPEDGRRFRIAHLAILRTADDTSLAIADDLLQLRLDVVYLDIYHQAHLTEYTGSTALRA